MRAPLIKSSSAFTNWRFFFGGGVHIDRTSYKDSFSVFPREVAYWITFQVCTLIISDCNGKKLLKSFNTDKAIAKMKVVQFLEHSEHDVIMKFLACAPVLQAWGRPVPRMHETRLIR